MSEETEIKQIDNRASGTPEMRYQYFEICQLTTYPTIEIKIVENEAQVFFDGNNVDTFDIKKIIMGIVEENILTIKDAEKRKQQIQKKREKLERKNKEDLLGGKLK